MAKRKNVPKKQIAIDRFPLIETALRKLTKADLISLIIELAKTHDVVCRDLESKLKVAKPVDLLASDISAAIERATDFDERMQNCNFDVDWQAYEEVKQGFLELVGLGHLDQVKQLALRLMKQGSYQVECSDEGLMSDEIEDCLTPVIRAVKLASSQEAKSWAMQMIAADKVGFICDQELKKLASG